MYKTENVQLRPNMLNRATEEDDLTHREIATVFRDSTNLMKKQSHSNKITTSKTDQPSLKQTQLETKTQGLGHGSQRNQNIRVSQLSNLLVDFGSEQDSQSEEAIKGSEKEITQVQNESSDQSSELSEPKSSGFQKQPEQRSEKKIKIPSKRCLFVDIDSDQEEAGFGQQKFPLHKIHVQYPESCSNSATPRNKHQNHQFDQISSTLAINTQDNLVISHKRQSLIHFSQDGQELSQEDSEIPTRMPKQPTENKRRTLPLTTLINQFGNKYYQSPIPQGCIFQCVIKRDRSESNVKYHFYECFSLRNFMTVIKDSDGFLFISKVNTKPALSDQQRQTVIGRLVSNFFGTEFNCVLEDIPYEQGSSYPVNKNAPKTITIEYETNFFGLAGPRKMSAYLPKQPTLSCQVPLNQVYQSENKSKQKSTILRFKNKTPIWCKQVPAYVLNFKGRATVSSIKNFMMIGEREGEEATERVLFGKFGKELFNLDVRHPFSLLQAAALAMSSFSRKIACQ